MFFSAIRKQNVNSIKQNVNLRAESQVDADKLDTDKAEYLHTREHITLVSFVQQLRERALYHAIKYKYDPVLSRAHCEYLEILNTILGNDDE